MFGLGEKSYQMIIDTFRLFPEIETAVIFGSRAMGTNRKGADVDIALQGKDISYAVVSKVSTRLNEELPLPYYFDVLHYEALDHRELKQHIDEEGKILYEKQYQYK